MVKMNLTEVFLNNLKDKIQSLEAIEAGKLVYIGDPSATDRFKSRVKNRKALLTAVEDLSKLLEHNILNAIEYDI